MGPASGAGRDHVPQQPKERRGGLRKGLAGNAGELLAELRKVPSPLA